MVIITLCVEGWAFQLVLNPQGNILPASAAPTCKLDPPGTIDISPLINPGLVRKINLSQIKYELPVLVEKTHHHFCWAPKKKPLSFWRSSPASPEGKSGRNKHTQHESWTSFRSKMIKLHGIRRLDPHFLGPSLSHLS